MSLPPDQPPPEKPKQSAAERRLQYEDRLKTIRLRMLIGRELDERGITTPAGIGDALDMPAAEATKLLRGQQWRCFRLWRWGWECRCRVEVAAPMIEAEVRRGTREDALRLSLAADASHGKQRTASDFKRGYEHRGTQ